ncbi:MAG: hypothetical protein AAGE89_11580 [Pseudomonadota bacterium]
MSIALRTKSLTSAIGKMTLFAAIATFIIPAPLHAEGGGPVGIAIASAPEQSSGVCFGENSVETLNCARKKCAAGDVYSASDCLRVLWCYPMGWSADIFVQVPEIHGHEYTCGWSSPAQLKAAIAVKCSNPFLIECLAVQVWSPDGKEVDVAVLDQVTDKPKDDNDTAWVLNDHPIRPALDLYGGPEFNDETLIFSLFCDRQSGSVSLLMREVGEVDEPAGENTCATLSTGGEPLKFCGSTIPNELAGIPDFNGSSPISDFSKFDLSTARSLNVAIKGRSTDFAFGPGNDRPKRFHALCKG